MMPQAATNCRRTNSRPYLRPRLMQGAYSLALLLFWVLAPSTAIAQTTAPTAPAIDQTAWTDIRTQLYGEARGIHDGRDILRLTAPDRALDAALVPVEIEALIDQTETRYIKALTLVIDENPAPVAGTFHLTPDNGVASIATRVRVNSYSMVRAIAEMNDGQLYMAEKFVKASGGCAAPAGKDHALAMSRLGEMRLRQVGNWDATRPAEAQLLISHPNYSGLQTDQLTQLWIPSHYIREVAVSLNGAPVLTFEADISLSENPSINFFLTPDADGEIAVRAVDTKDNVFEKSWPVKLGPSS
jgi:sulfur-oxidizing protein SoxY